MGQHVSDTGFATSTGADVRLLLSTWKNDHDEWVQAIVRQALSTGRALVACDVGDVYALFRQEKALDARTLPKGPPLAAAAPAAESKKFLRVTSLSEITGVNALVSGAVMTPHEGLAILHGENSSGKTGYSRLFKPLAASRTADQILGDVSQTSEFAQGALIVYDIGESEPRFRWSGETGDVAPSTRRCRVRLRSREPGVAQPRECRHSGRQGSDRRGPHYLRDRRVGAAVLDPAARDQLPARGDARRAYTDLRTVQALADTNGDID